MRISKKNSDQPTNAAGSISGSGGKSSIRDNRPEALVQAKLDTLSRSMHNDSPLQLMGSTLTQTFGSDCYNGELKVEGMLEDGATVRAEFKYDVERGGATIRETSVSDDVSVSGSEGRYTLTWVAKGSTPTGEKAEWAYIAHYDGSKFRFSTIDFHGDDD